jgi:hypothetical protein
MSARFLLALSAFTLLVAGMARAEDKTSWDGVWIGSFGSGAPVSIAVAHDRVTTYLYRGAALPILYSRIGAADVKFGDRQNYAVSLTKIGADAAKAVYHGRNGYASATLRRQ